MEESVCTYVSKDNFDQLQRSNVVSTLIHLETFNIQDARGCIHTSPCMKLYTYVDIQIPEKNTQKQFVPFSRP